jgi:hypothetical protein
MPPLWQYLAMIAFFDRQTSPLRPPKGMDPGLCGISPANQPSQEPAGGAMIAAMDPRQAAARW